MSAGSSDSPAPVLRAEGLVKTHYGEGAPAYAVRGVELCVRQGEFVAVTGPSGAGKSTLLHLLGGLQRPDGGSILLDGERTDTMERGALGGGAQETDRHRLPVLQSPYPDCRSPTTWSCRRCWPGCRRSGRVPSGRS